MMLLQLGFQSLKVNVEGGHWARATARCWLVCLHVILKAFENLIQALQRLTADSGFGDYRGGKFGRKALKTHLQRSGLLQKGLEAGHCHLWTG